MEPNKGEYFVIVSAIIIILIFVISFVIIDFSFNYWRNERQTLMTYQQIYEKNQDCRSALRSYHTRYVDEICGKIPMYDDYFKR